MKTLKDMFEVYRPKSPDEQKFVDKHVIVKQKDRNEVNGKANGDDVFNATNVKTVDHKATRHGYAPGEEEKVYEENEFVNEEELVELDLKVGGVLNRYGAKAADDPNRQKGKALADRKQYRAVPGTTTPKVKAVIREEEELVDEGMLGGLFKKKPKVTVGKMTAIKDLPDGEKPFQKMTGQGTPKPQPEVQRDDKGRTLYQRVKDVRDKKQMTKEEIINRAIEKYMPEVADIKPLTMEERLAKKLDGLSEGHTALLFSLFSNLNEDNQMKMIESCSDRDGINELIDFALENRGE